MPPPCATRRHGASLPEGGEKGGGAACACGLYPERRGRQRGGPADAKIHEGRNKKAEISPGCSPPRSVGAAGTGPAGLRGR